MSDHENMKGRGTTNLGHCEREGCEELGFRAEGETEWVCGDCRTSESMRTLTAQRDGLVQGLKKLLDGAEERGGHMTIKTRAVNRLINRLGLR